MAKVKLKEATKELNQKASEILEDSARIRRSAEMLLQQLQRQKQQQIAVRNPADLWKCGKYQIK